VLRLLFTYQAIRTPFNVYWLRYLSILFRIVWSFYGAPFSDGYRCF
jgi:hypothetical protein